MAALELRWNGDEYSSHNLEVVDGLITLVITRNCRMKLLSFRAGLPYWRKLSNSWDSESLPQVGVVSPCELPGNHLGAGAFVG